jgi:hypothetical protein
VRLYDRIEEQRAIDQAPEVVDGHASWLWRNFGDVALGHVFSRWCRIVSAEFKSRPPMTSDRSIPVGITKFVPEPVWVIGDSWCGCATR